MGSSVKLTVFFEDPFWVAVAEESDEKGYRAARHVFGPEPTQPDVEHLVLFEWDHLQFTQQSKTPLNAPSEKAGFKRAQRLAKKALATDHGCGTKAQQALQAQYEASKAERIHVRSQRKAEQLKARFALKQEKRKKKARGH